MVIQLDDQQARETALHTHRSFIVQAPAGSGKTELLIQRYLALLATVDEPEQVVAITFTRKAAAEMRKRVLSALHAASTETTGLLPHQVVTLELARAVVHRDAHRDWSLSSLPQRLRIDTLDAFNVSLAQQLPVLSDGVAAARITEDATEQYRQAARRTVEEIGDGAILGQSLRGLLRSLDNDLVSLEHLLAGLLPRREQWLGHLARSNPTQLRIDLERALHDLVIDQLNSITPLWPELLLRELLELLEHAARFAEDSRTRQALEEWLRVTASAPTTRTKLAAWRAVAGLLLTQKGEWRRKVSKKEGFGPEHPALRERWRSLLDALTIHEPLREALEVAASLPDPHYTDLQWDNLAALQVVLIHLAAELKVVFAEQRCVDFVELGLAAQRALGQTDAPSELLLALDRRIQHLLVDEFQDTSQAQLRLLELLTAGWQPGDGRSLFLVGDPMQSIYRFRDADMSLFLKVKQRGLGTVSLASLTLQRNFRSSSTIVEWINRVFATVFPPHDEIATGTAGFYPCLTTRAAGEHQFVRTHALRTADPRAEVERVIDILEEERMRNERQSIAVLVQSRSHLAGLHQRLQAKGWPVHAVEIDALRDQQLGQDLIGLTRALTHFGDRIAWLGLLRAPWCGLGWADLHALCHDAPQRTIWELLHDRRHVGRLSPQGQRRAARTRDLLTAAFSGRALQPFARWVERTWIDLDGPACLDATADFSVAEQFFAALGQYERRGDIEDPARLEEAFAKAEPHGDPPREAGIEVMTMHRAKGLEFDTVVLLGLGRETRPDDPKALYWMERVGAGDRDDLIMAPLTALGDDDRLTSFVKRAERQRDLTERARLLYVASTRARDRLHLVGQLAPTRDEPPAHTLLAHLWPEVGAQFAAHGDVVADVGRPPASFQPVLRRLVESSAILHAAKEPPVPAAAIETATARPEFAWSSPAAVHVGTVVHGYLQRIAEDGVERWTTAMVKSQSRPFRAQLQLLGVETEDLRLATERVFAALNQVLEDPRGRWVLSEHPEARSELRLTLRSATGLEHIRLDRTFVEDDARWIIDFKTGQHQGGDVETFLDTEVERYRPQLERYAAAMSMIDGRAVKAGLYFPLLRAFRSWSAELP
ncbi:MAG TPA: UvrD-helicase domain-containing protein [Gammaproteobacteria bacterium]|nr:UvrD-helicase domain-containing protein [Gammaproteobacteria bacterium]